MGGGGGSDLEGDRSSVDLGVNSALIDLPSLHAAMIYRVKTQTAAAGPVDSVSPYFMLLNFRHIIDSGVLREQRGMWVSIARLEPPYSRDEKERGACNNIVWRGGWGAAAHTGV